MHGGVVKRQLVDGGPQVQDIALGSTLRLKTLEDVVTEMDRAGSLARGRASWRLGVHRARAASLLGSTLELAQEPQMFEHLLAQIGEIDAGSRAGCRRNLGRRGWIDRGRHRFYAGGSRGDHLLCWDLIPVVAHGFFVNSVRRRGRFG